MFHSESGRSPAARRRTRCAAAPAWPLPWLCAALLAVSLPALACDTAEECFGDGLRFYEAEDFEQAVASLERAVELEPGRSTFHLWLGRSVGRMAEQSQWLRALTLAPRVLHEFETAVALDDSNVDALRDLATYYRRAPGFLGGSDSKAEALERRIEALEAAAGERPEAP
jgi:tetratricopeptide (TPR) repeat protein